MNRRREENSVRVSNLSEDTREQDLQELFRPFGPVTRIYVAFNRETGESRVRIRQLRQQGRRAAGDQQAGRVRLR